MTDQISVEGLEFHGVPLRRERTRKGGA